MTVTSTPSTAPSLAKRIAFSLLLAAIAAGMLFYVVLFLGLIAQLGTGALNPAIAPRLVHVLHAIAAPVSGVAALIVFILAIRRNAAR